MTTSGNTLIMLFALLTLLCAPAHATVQIASLTPSKFSPQVIGASISWTATATDSHPGPLTFQFSVGVAGQPLKTVKDFNVGTLAASTWTSLPFVWTPVGVEGGYKICVTVKDFASGESATKTAQYVLHPLSTAGSPVAVATANPLVALFSAPSCAAGSFMRVTFQPQSKNVPATTT